MMELSDDELGVIFRSITDPNDRTSISLVSKQWLRVEGLTRSSVRALSPDLLSAFLPRFPNLTAFDSPALIDDSQALYLASYCPKIETLILDFDDEGGENDAVSDSDDITDVGLYAIAKWCRNLSALSVRNRRKIGDIGVFSLVRFSCNLNSLDLSGCTSLTDQALLAVGLMGSIESLSLQGCSLITDKGLAMLSFEPLSKNLKKLALSGCDRITDLGVVSLSKMSALEELSLADCGHGITELGGLSISRIRSLKRLDLARLNLADLTLILVAEGCVSLIEVVIDGCGNISGQGVSAFGAHKSLEVFSMAACHGVSMDCVKQLVSECPSLKSVRI